MNLESQKRVEAVKSVILSVVDRMMESPLLTAEVRSTIYSELLAEFAIREEEAEREHLGPESER